MNNRLTGLKKRIAVPAASVIWRVMLDKCAGMGSVGGAPLHVFEV